MTTISERIASARRKATSVVMAGVLTVGMMPLPAYAQGLQAGNADFSETVATQESKATNTHVIGAAYAAAEPAPDILGLDNPESRGDANRYNKDSMNMWVWGTDNNESPDPWFQNTLQVMDGSDKTASPTIIVGARSGGPMAELPAYSTATADAAKLSNKVWNYLPDVVIGTGASSGAADGDLNHYAASARAIETAKGLEADSYNPKGIVYNNNNLNSMVDIMYAIAAAADEADKADNGHSLRYGSATEIAKDYERYAIGTKGYVLKKIEEGAVPMRTVASVSNYDSTAGTYTIRQYGVSEGTATGDRYLESVQGTVVNYADSAKTTTVTASELADNVDLIIVGGQGGNDQVALNALTADGLIDKTYYSGVSANAGTGSTFTLTANSVENAQNVGRILPCIYPEILSQSDMVAYYYDKFYHLKTANVKAAMDKWMDGTRNWNVHTGSALDTWNESDIQDGFTARVQSTITEGMGYLNGQKAAQDPTKQYSENKDLLEPTANVAGDAVSLASATVQVADQAYTGSALSPDITIVSGSTKIEKVNEKTDGFDVTYADNTNVGTAKVTVKAKEGNTYGFTANTEVSGTFRIATAITTEGTVTIETIADQQYTGKQIIPEVTVKYTKQGGTEQTLTADTDYTVSVTTGFKNTDVTKNDDETTKGSVTITGAGAYMGELGTATFNIVKGDVSGATLSEASDTYTGSTFTPDVRLANGTKLVVGTDGDVTMTITGYSDSSETAAATDELPTEIKNAGTYTLKFDAKDTTKYDGSKAGVTFTVNKAKGSDIKAKTSSTTTGRNGQSSTTWTTVTNLGTFEKGADTPTIPDMYLGDDTTTKLVKDTDYTITDFSSATEGAQKITITGAGNNIDNTTSELTYLIVADTTIKDASENAVEADISKLTVSDAVKLDVDELEDSAIPEEAKASALSGDNNANIYYDVKLEKVSDDSEITSDFGTLTLKFNVGEEYAGYKGYVNQFHKDALGQTVLYKQTAINSVGEDGIITVQTDALSVFAISLQATYTVKFDANGGSDVADQVVTDGDSIETAPTTTRENYTFTRWVDENGDEVTFPYTPTGNVTLTANWDVNSQVMHRLYNPNSGEHFYTASDYERDSLVSIGWKSEGEGWTAPVEGEEVYRMYNPNAGDHHYTKSAYERDHLVDVGWIYERVGWMSADENGENSVPLYRQYNPNAKAGAHNYTTSKTENDHLKSVGWNEEGIAWYGLKDAE